MRQPDQGMCTVGENTLGSAAYSLDDTPHGKNGIAKAKGKGCEGGAAV
jgi:hypothetical protein